jgi:oxaloacetate decarboxylase gamma subunit
MESGLVNEGLTLMLVGMGTVFVFLTTLVIAMTLMARLLPRFQHEPASAEITNEEIAAISAAIAQHRRK